MIEIDENKLWFCERKGYHSTYLTWLDSWKELSPLLEAQKLLEKAEIQIKEKMANGVIEKND